jgi:3'5'-cyclic nucleotide phosphodiesterase
MTTAHNIAGNHIPSNVENNPAVPVLELLTPETLVRTGYSIMSTEWNMLGLGDTSNLHTKQAPPPPPPSSSTSTPTVPIEDTAASSTSPSSFMGQHIVETGDPVQLQHRITAIFAARCAAIVSPPEEYNDLSTKTICHTIMTQKNSQYPLPLMQNDCRVLQQISEFIRRMIMGYKDVPYHNRKHAYHVVLSTTKLLDMMILSGARTYGIKHDPIALFAMIFAALIHDVEHQGIPNRQLALEDDRLAVLYNDQSMAENWSLYVVRDG